MRPNKKKASPCKAITRYNTIILFLVKWSIQILSFFLLPKRNQLLQFEENPASMTWKELLYFGYKYYVRNMNHFSPSNAFLSFNDGPILFTEQTSQQELSIHVSGDLMPYQLINQEVCKELWKEKNELFNADITVANLETPVDLNQKSCFVPELMLSDMNFNSSSQQFDIFNGEGFDVLSLANNHTLDMGYSGAANTLDFLSKKGIATCGVGEKGNTHSIIEQKGFKIGFISYTYSLNQYQIDETKELQINLLPLNKLEGCDISKIKNEAKLVKELGAEFIILMVHTGNAYQAMPGKQTQKIFKEIAENTEVDFIVGGHPHNIQPIEQFSRGDKNVIAAYSLGDFIAYDIYKRCNLSLTLAIELIRIKGKVVLKKLSAMPNYMQYENEKLKLRDFNTVMKEKKNDKKIRDLQWLYQRTILEPNV